MDDPFRFRQYQPRALEIIDTTLRDGQQTSLLHDHHKYFFTRADKEELTRALIIYGVKFIELFAPLVSPQEREDWQALRAVRDSLITQKGYTFFLAHVRCHPRDVESALEAGADGLNFYIGTSAESRAFNHGHDLDTLIKKAATLLEEVRRNYPYLIVRFSGEDAFRTRDDTVPRTTPSRRMSIDLARPTRWASPRRRVWRAACARCASAIRRSNWKDTSTTIAASR
jgi:homocitrate synthase